MTTNKNNVKNVIAELKDFTAKNVIKLSVEINSNLKEDTPKDTRWASANWIGNVGNPFRGVIGSNGEVSLSGYQAGLDRLLKYKIGDGNIYISNNVPYIQKLNDGHSKQAPKNFVSASVMRALEKFK